MALSITVNGGGTFTASMEEGPVSFTASLAAVGPAGPGVAAGGAEGQILVKASATDYDTEWIDNSARSEFITARNNTGTEIGKGKVVYLSGATGNKATMALAQANSEATSARTIGITKASVPNNQDGDVIISGEITGLDTSAFNAGDVLYLSESAAGGLRVGLPTQPNHGVVIGIVTRSHPSLGSIEVTIQNYQELEELSDVLITSATNLDLLSWESSSSVWKNKSFATLGLLTSASAASTYQTLAGMSSYLAKADNLSGLANLATSRTNLGLGTTDSVVFGQFQVGSAPTFTTVSTTNFTVLDTSLLNPIQASLSSSGLELNVSGAGITFPDATVQTTAATTPDLTPYAEKAATNTFTASQVVEVTDNSNAALRITQLGTGDALRVEDSSNPDSTPFIITSSGNVGIGTTSTVGAFNVTGRSYLTNTSAAGGNATLWVRQQSGGTTALQVTNQGAGVSFVVEDEVSDTTPFIVDAGGNVGVKTASPSTDFEVAGNAKFTTGNITTAPAAGDSSSLIPTTAWVQAEVPAASTTAAGKVELATDAEASALLSTSLALTPSAVLSILRNAGVRRYTGSDFNAVGTSSGATSINANGIEVATTATTSGSFAYRAVATTNSSPQSLGKARGVIDFSKKTWFGTRVLRQGTNDANAVFRISLGKIAATDSKGDLARLGFGVLLTGTGNFECQAHNGTTLTKSTNGTTGLASTSAFDVDVYSDGAGNVSVYVNGTQTASCTGGPTGDSGSTANAFMVEVENIAAASATTTFSVGQSYIIQLD